MIAKEVMNKLDYINDKKPRNLERKKDKGVIKTDNGKISRGNNVKHCFESLYPSLSIYKESSDGETSNEEEARDLRSKEVPIIIGDVETSEEGNDVITMNPKKPIQLEPKLDDLKIEVEMCFCKKGWSLLNLEEYSITHLEGTP